MKALALGLAASLTAIGCAPASGEGRADTTGHAGGGSGGSAGGGAAPGGGQTGSAGSSGGASGGSSSTPNGSASLGFVVVDVQQTFVTNAANVDIAKILSRTQASFELSGATGVPLLVTFEASKQADHALHPTLVPSLPAHALELVKTTYAATGLPSFASAVQQSGRTHWVVMGAETDVCVLQTVLGLRQLGYHVLLQHDAVLSSEPNTSPALRRMQQAGVQLVSQSEVSSYVAAPASLPEVDKAEVVVTEPLKLGVLLNDLTDATLGASPDGLAPQKLARLRELLLVSEWFDLPVYATEAAGLPASLAQYFQGKLRPASQIAQDVGVEQLLIAGTDSELQNTLSTWAGARQLFVMEDGLLALGTSDAQKQLLDALYPQGVVPTTYKSFYYEMTQSVELSEWPSQTWVQRFEEYYYITQAPEDLPPMPPS